MLRVMAWTLAVLMLLTGMSSLTACGDSDEQETASETMTPDTVGQTETGNGTEVDGTEDANTPEDYDGRTAYDDMEKTKFHDELVILTRDELSSDFKIAEDDAGASLLDELLLERNHVIEEDFGVILNVLKGGDFIQVNESVKSQYVAGLDEYDVAIGQKFSFTSCVVNNYLMDMKQISTLSLDEVWWDQVCNDDLSIRGKTFVATGDIQPSAMLISSCFVFNKRMMRDLGQTEPYDLVREYKWTLDTFNEYTAGVTMDVNGDGEIDGTLDRFGLTSWLMDAPYSMFYAAGGMLIGVDENNEPVLQFETADVVDRYEKIFRSLIEQDAYFLLGDDQYNTPCECFVNGHALFLDGTLSKVKDNLTRMSDDYGIVPLPMYDEMQKEYKSFVNGATGFIMIIATEKKAEYVGTVLDAMARYNYQEVSPKLFEVVSKLQSVRDEESSEMVEYIIRNRVYDLAYYLNLDISNVVMFQLVNKQPEITSALKMAEKSANKALNRIIKGVGKD